MVEINDEARERLARLVAERRKSISLSVSGAARQAHIDRGTWTGVEKGTRETEEYNYASVERVLGWEPGSIDTVLAGGDPTVQQVVPDAPPPNQERLGPLPDDDAIAAVMRSSRIPEEQKRRIVRILIEDRDREQQRRLALAEDLIRTWEETA